MCIRDSYYAGNVIYNNQHKELTIKGNLSAQQMMKIAKDFFAEDTEVTEEMCIRDSLIPIRKVEILIHGREDRSKPHTMNACGALVFLVHHV